MINPDWAQGIAASIRCAIEAQGESDACILMLGDQPNVTAADLAALIAAHEDHRGSIVALRRGRLWGAPVLFPRRDYASVRGRSGDRGAKEYANSNARRLVFVEAARPDAFIDLDTPRDAKRL